MANFLTNKVKDMTQITDEIIANNMLASSVGASNAYLNATISCSTPELRAIFGANLNQVLSGHSAMMELAIKKGWEDPYKTPAQQLSEIYQKSKDSITKE